MPTVTNEYVSIVENEFHIFIECLNVRTFVGKKDGVIDYIGAKSCSIHKCNKCHLRSAKLYQLNSSDRCFKEFLNLGESDGEENASSAYNGLKGRSIIMMSSHIAKLLFDSTKITMREVCCDLLEFDGINNFIGGCVNGNKNLTKRRETFFTIESTNLLGDPIPPY